jgi:hypothetical protein
MISVVIPLFNKGRSVGRAVEAILAQTHTDWELIVVDDGSTDGSAQVVAGYKDPRIRIIAQSNSGVSAARNTGLAAARSKLVAFLDADDFWDPDHLSDLAQAATLLPDCAFWSSAYRFVDDNGWVSECRLPKSRTGRIVRIEDYFAQATKYDNPVHSSAVMVDKDVLTRLGGFPVGVKLGEDLITWAKLACAGSLGYVGRATSSYVRPPIDWKRKNTYPEFPDMIAAGLASLARSSTGVAGLERFRGDWHRIRSMQFLEVDQTREAWRELWLSGRHGGPRVRDVVCGMLLCLPPHLRRIVLWLIRTHRLRRSVPHDHDIYVQESPVRVEG